MPIQLSEEQSKNRPEELKQFNRLKHTTEEQQYLRTRGFTPVVSSNVSAVARDVDKLIVRFHGGATYVYPGSGNKFDSMLSASSKGRFVWQQLRKANVAYYRVGNYNIPDDVESRDMMQPMAESDVTVLSRETEQARATTVNVKQAYAQETIIDIRQIPRVTPPRTARVNASDALLSSMFGVDDVLAQGIIAGIFLAEIINNAEEADNSRQA